MSHRYCIDSDNAFLSLAIQHIFDELEPEIWPENEGRILILSEKKRIQDILSGKRYRLEEYDLIICSEPYYTLCRKYIGKVTRKIISVDNGINTLKKDIIGFFTHDEEPHSLNDISQLMTLTQNERVTITKYISPYDNFKSARQDISNLKTTSRYKRAAMSKLGFTSNIELWLAINFLFYLGYISFYNVERKNKVIILYHQDTLQDNVCYF